MKRKFLLVSSIVLTVAMLFFTIGLLLNNGNAKAYTENYFRANVGNLITEAEGVECKELGRTSAKDHVDVCKVGKHFVCLVFEKAGFKCHKVRPHPDTGE